MAWPYLANAVLMHEKEDILTLSIRVSLTKFYIWPLPKEADSEGGLRICEAEPPSSTGGEIHFQGSGLIERPGALDQSLPFPWTGTSDHCHDRRFLLSICPWPTILARL